MILMKKTASRQAIQSTCRTSFLKSKKSKGSKNTLCLNIFPIQFLYLISMDAVLSAIRFTKPKFQRAKAITIVQGAN